MRRRSKPRSENTGHPEEARNGTSVERARCRRRLIATKVPLTSLAPPGPRPHSLTLASWSLPNSTRTARARYRRRLIATKVPLTSLRLLRIDQHYGFARFESDEGGTVKREAHATKEQASE